MRVCNLDTREHSVASGGVTGSRAHIDSERFRDRISGGRTKDGWNLLISMSVLRRREMRNNRG